MDQVGNSGGRPLVSRYTVYVTPVALRELRELPGNIRQRARRAIDDLAENPRPAASQQLDLPQVEASVWRQRMDRWRNVYIITELDRFVDVLAVRRRPPYDYGDIAELLSQLN